MNTVKNYLLLSISILFLSFSAHKYYISFTKIDYSEKNKAIQITMTVFIDDLENGLKNQFQIEPELTTKEELTNIDDYISKYIADKFFVTINNKTEAYNYLGKKYDSDEMKLYIEIENINNIQSIEIKNNMLMEIYSDQQNIIKLNINKKKKSFILTSKNDKDLLKL